MSGSISDVWFILYWHTRWHLHEIHAFAMSGSISDIEFIMVWNVDIFTEIHVFAMSWIIFNVKFMIMVFWTVAPSWNSCLGYEWEYLRRQFHGSWTSPVCPPSSRGNVENHQRGVVSISGLQNQGNMEMLKIINVVRCRFKNFKIKVMLKC